MSINLTPASKMARRIKCAGSGRMEAECPALEESDAVKEGIAAHALIASQLTGTAMPDPDLVDDEMLDAADVAVNELLTVCKAEGMEPSSLMVERPVQCALGPQAHNYQDRPDYWLYSPVQRKLYVWDFKYGHRHVEVFENAALMTYAADILKALGILSEPIDVSLRVIQPRWYGKGGPVRTWDTTSNALRGYWNQMANACEAVWSSNPQCAVSSECYGCNAARTCPALQKAAYAAIEYADEATPFELDNPALGRELQLLEDAMAALEARKMGLEAQATSTIRGGNSVPGYALEAGVGREKWSKSPEEVAALGDMLGIDVRKPALLTPAQARKKGLPTPAGYTETPAGALKLTRVDLRAARAAFAKEQ